MRIVSGIQPNASLHLGHYLGAVRHWAKMQDEAQCLFLIADLHAITVYKEPAELIEQVRAMTASLLACGIDPDKSILFNQSRVAAHSELAWILSCTARMGWLNAMAEYKDKSRKSREGASVGLFAYPILQAADVLLYQATHLPVGADQLQHVELIRDVAARFNGDFEADFFTLPEALLAPNAAQIMSLRDGSVKMAQSDPSDMSRINLADDPDLIAQKVRKARTDPEPLPDNLDALTARPEARNLVLIYAALASIEPQQVLDQFAGQGFGRFKPALADLLVESLRPIQQRLAALRLEPDQLDLVLEKGAERAAMLAEPILERAYRAVGLGR